MPDRYIRLNDSGVILSAYWAGVSDGVLTIQFAQDISDTLAHIVTLLDDASNTAVIYFNDADEEKTFEGYTHIITAMDRRNQNHGVMAQLIKGGVE